MEKFCQALHLDVVLNPNCRRWFQQAAEHCERIILNTTSSAQFWNTLKSTIFGWRQTDFNQDISTSFHPEQLSRQHCYTLVEDIIDDYMLRAPCYAAKEATNALIQQTFYSILSMMALGTLVVGQFFAYRKFGRALYRRETKNVANAPAQCISKQEKATGRLNGQHKEQENTAKDE